MTPRTHRGSNAVEFALVLPIVLGVLSAVVDFGYFLQQQRMVFDAIHDGVRSGVTIENTEDAELTAVQHATDMLERGGFDCAHCKFETSTYEETYFDVLVVEAFVPFEPLLGIMPTPDQFHVQYSMARESVP